MPGPELTMGLADASRADVGRVGGKAANLGELMDKGFPVPGGFVVTTDAYALFAEHNDLKALITRELEGVDYSDPRSLEEHAAHIRDAVLSSKFPAELAAEIKERYGKMGSLPVAVRSSATAEDLASASFAGQLETYLNIKGPRGVVEAVKKCYASLWSGRALSYGKQSGFTPGDAAMAVLIQHMIPAQSAGVMFTVSPLSTDGSEFLIESTLGLGEALVSGRATPDKYVLGRNGDGSFKILAEEIGEKKTVARGGKGGVEYVELDGEQGSKPSITDEQALKLAKMGDRIQVVMGTPQDVEWAIGAEDEIYVLQSRPITTIRAENEDEIVWTRGYSDDYWNDPVTPLYFELLGDHLTQYVNVELNEIMGYKSLDSPKTRQLLKLHKAHAYFNLEVLKRKVENEIPPFLRNDDVLNYFPEGSGPYGKETMRGLRFNTVGRVLAEIRVTFKDPNGGGGKTDKAYTEWSNGTFAPFFNGFPEQMKALEGAPLADYIALADEIHELMIGHYRLVRYGIPVHNIGMNLLTQYLLARFLGVEEGRRVYPILVSGLRHKTSETNERIGGLAVKVRASPKLRKMILEKPSRELYDRISSSKLGEAAEFKGQLDSFIAEYGVRGFTRETYYPRWGDEPGYIFDILKSLAEGEAVDTAAAEEKSGKLREETDKRVKDAIGGQFLGFAKLSLLSGIMGSARRYIVFREQQRFNLDKWITMTRRLHLALGARLVEKGMLGQPSDIFFLTKGEIRGIAGGETPEGVRATVASRRAEFLKYENATPPKFLQGDREFNDPPPADADHFRGIPASQGVLTAPVRVLGSIEDIWQVQAGEILVVPRTDPGWTPVFSKIGGLITETGGILSHGAVVSREYGIPAVTNIHEACRVFKTGQRVTIDGVKGEVTVEQ
ncbi:MAG: PEP-utilizing enzyme [Candidatus Bathyarchaeota archaeon]|nr:PEP-utilizing enzyme [Candidatus Bathyarchaeota archaeon]